MVRTLPIHRSVKPSLGGLLNKIIQDCIQITLKLAAISVGDVGAANMLCVTNMCRESKDDQERYNDVEWLKSLPHRESRAGNSSNEAGIIP